MTDGLLIAYYGDDFTGSTDVLEALAGHGVPTVLFTRVPTDAQRARFAGCRAVGLAGESRSRPPGWMDRELPAVFAWLRALGAPLVHYKVCSTFDSAPRRGSIGRALELGLAAFGQDVAPIVVGAPQLGRFTVFGHLFAAAGGDIFRIDRHPVMSRHPATPMTESDLLLHLARQTGLPTARIDLADHLAERQDAALAAACAAGARAVLVDVYDGPSQARAGRLLAERFAGARPFVVGSSGVEYALLGAWRAQGRLAAPAAPAPLRPVERLLVASGSCSTVTEAQIRTALDHGFTGVALDYAALAAGDAAAYDRALAEGRRILAAGGSPVLYTALGPVESTPGAADDDRVGRTLGRLLDQLAGEHALERLVLAGGDTSSHAVSALDVHALTLRHPIPQSPGSPVCTAHREGGPPLELTLKGGQIGGPDYFARLRDGTL